MKSYLRTSIFNKIIIGLVFTVISLIGHSGEFLIIDRYVTWDVDAQSAFYMFLPDAGMPPDWLYPDDYYHGMIYTRYQIMSVATSIPCGMQFGIFQWKDAGHTVCGELCENIRWLSNGAGSVAENGSSPSTWWQSYGGVDFSKIGDLQSLCPTIWSQDPRSPVAKPGEGGDEAGIAWSRRYNWFPITVRVTIVAVSAGSSFSGWNYYLGDNPGNQPLPDACILYPNPSINGEFTIQTEMAVPYHLQVFSPEGRMLRIIEISIAGPQQISLADLKKGMYVIRIVKGGRAFMRKIIIG